MVSITALVITYNQENVIGRALDSVLQQSEWGLKEIVVCDDCSSDRNWEVIQTYANNYPQFIRAYRNIPNLGIYNNLEKVFSLRGEADVYIELAGDDIIYNGFFKRIQEFIETNFINVEEDASLICMDYAVIRPDGKNIKMHPNKVLKKCKEAKRLRLRGSVYLRGSVRTKKLMDRYQKIAEGKSVTLAELLCEIQFFQNADSVYYCPFVANGYYSQRGISTTMKNKKHYQQTVEKWDYIYNNVPLCEKDQYFALLQRFLSIYAITPTTSTFAKIIKYYFLSRDLSIPFNKYFYFFSIRKIVKSTLRLSL